MVIVTVTERFFILLQYVFLSYSFIAFTSSSWGLMLCPRIPSSFTLNTIFFSQSHTRQVRVSISPSSTPTSPSLSFFRIQSRRQTQNSYFWLLGTVRSSGRNTPTSLLCNPLSFSLAFFSNQFSLMQRILLTNYSLTKPHPCSTSKDYTSFESIARTSEPVMFRPESLCRYTFTYWPISCFLANSRELKAPSSSPTGERTIASSIFTFSSVFFRSTSKTYPSNTSETSPTKLFLAQMKPKISVFLPKIPICCSFACAQARRYSSALEVDTRAAAFTIPHPLCSIDSQIYWSSSAWISKRFWTILQTGLLSLTFTLGFSTKKGAKTASQRHANIEFTFLSFTGTNNNSLSRITLNKISSVKYSTLATTSSSRGKYFRIALRSAVRSTNLASAYAGFFSMARKRAFWAAEYILLYSSSFWTTSMAPAATFWVRKASFWYLMWVAFLLRVHSMVQPTKPLKRDRRWGAGRTLNPYIGSSKDAPEGSWTMKWPLLEMETMRKCFIYKRFISNPQSQTKLQHRPHKQPTLKIKHILCEEIQTLSGIESNSANCLLNNILAFLIYSIYPIEYPPIRIQTNFTQLPLQSLKSKWATQQ